MDVTLDTARDLWAVRFGYDWVTYSLGYETDLANPFWYPLLLQLRENACLDIDYAAGRMRLKP